MKRCKYVALLLVKGPMSSSSMAKHFGCESGLVSRIMNAHLDYGRYGVVRAGRVKADRANTTNFWAIDPDKYETYVAERRSRNMERLNAMRKQAAEVKQRRLAEIANQSVYKTQWLPSSPYCQGA